MILKGCRSQTIEIGGKTIGLSGATFERPKHPRCAKTGRFKAVAKRHPIITSKFKISHVSVSRSDMADALAYAHWAWLSHKQKTR